MLNMRILPKRITIIAALLLFLALLFTGRALALGDKFFLKCDEVLEKKEFRLLKNYFEKTGNESAEMCCRLNNNEFLVTAVDGLYYYNAKNTVYQLHDDARLPYLEVEQQFVGRNGNRYVLLYWSSPPHYGRYSYVYGVLDLTPPTVGNKPYVLYGIFAIWVDEDADTHAVWTKDRNGTNEEIYRNAYIKMDTPKILNEGSSDVQILFTPHVISDRTKEVKIHEVKFKPSDDGLFRRVK